MNEAASTWALVVGIDEYADPSFLPSLTGAVNDAIAAVRWLRSLGVPDAQILLCASPSEKSKRDLDGLGLPYAAADAESIWKTAKVLETAGGTRLFVFLSGHGVWEINTDAQLFLTHDAVRGEVRNLSIDWYAQWLASTSFTSQFFFLDGCQNAVTSASDRQTIAPETRSYRPASAARADVVQTLCSAAGISEVAAEDRDSQRGLFLSTLLPALDPAAPTPACVAVDDATGLRFLDLGLAMYDVVGPKVTDRAGLDGLVQHPQIRRLRGNASDDALPIATLPGEAVQLTVSFEPAEAVDDVTSLLLHSPAISWDRQLGGRSGKPVGASQTWNVPAGLEVQALPKGVAPIVPELQGGRADADLELAFRIVDDLGGPAPLGLDDGDGPGNRMAERGGPLHSPGGRPAAPAPLPRVQFTLTPPDVWRLAGPLGGQRRLQLGVERTTLDTVAAGHTVPVFPGPLRVALDLPWGRWTTEVQVEPEGVTTVELPEHVGRPPLRTTVDPALLDRLAAHPFPCVVVGASELAIVDASSEARLEPAPVMPFPQDVPIGPALALGADLPFPPAFAIGELTDGEGRATCFPIGWMGEAVAVDRPAGGYLRAEAVSSSPDALWDVLLSAGDLAVDVRGVDERGLADAAPVLALAVAYARHAQGESVATLLAAITSTYPESADAAILAAACVATADGTGKRTAAAERLRRLGPATPVLRWGVALGITAARAHDAPDLLAHLEAIERRLVPGSVWTLWHAA